MTFVYNNKEYPDQAARDAYLKSLKPIKAWEDLGETFDPIPAPISPDAFCKVTFLYISELYARKNWFCTGKDAIMVLPDICALLAQCLLLFVGFEGSLTYASVVSSALSRMVPPSVRSLMLARAR